MSDGNGNAEKTGSNEAPAGPRVTWDDRNLKSAYANVCNVSSTREEVVLLFGVNQSWQGGAGEVAVELTDRIILSPFAAKRLSMLLENVVKQYEGRFGSLDAQGQQVTVANGGNAGSGEAPDSAS